MRNRDIQAAWAYHNATKHSVARLRARPHSLDWEIKPLPFKVYPRIEAIPFPRELPQSSAGALVTIAQREIPAGQQPKIPDLASVARILHFSAGITRTRKLPSGQEYYFRAAACTGALYHIDLYVICGDLPGLRAGVYHFGPHNFTLHQLRVGDYRGALVEATGAEASVQHAPIIIACASTYWRNSWKYEARAYRHCFWDCGTTLANLLAVAAGDGLPARVVCGFVDETVTRLLGMDPLREGPLALVTLGHDPPGAIAPALPMPTVSFDTLPLSPREVDYAAIREMHAASVLHTPDEVRAWRASGASPAASPASLPAPFGQLYPLRPLGAADLPTESIDSVILRRGSTRWFAQAPMRFEHLSTILDHSTRGIPSDFGGPLNDVYLIVNAVEGLPPGAYVYHRGAQALELLRAGEFRSEAGYLGLGQQLPADASVNLYFLSNLEPVLAGFGNRGYRVAQLDAALAGGKVYLAAYALRLGATGLTFFDDDVTAFFSPHAAGKSVMFLVAAGRGKKRLPHAT